MAEYYRQFAFVSSVLAGFAFTFYATLLAINRPHRAVSWAALLTVTASICFLTVTLGTTFAATQVAGIEDRASLPPALRQQLPLLSTLFLAGFSCSCRALRSAAGSGRADSGSPPRWLRSSAWWRSTSRFRHSCTIN
jgi:hypothetical protein